MAFPIGQSDSRTSISISKHIHCKECGGQGGWHWWLGILEGSRISCSITNDVAFLENSAAGPGGAFVVANGTNFSIEQAWGSVF